jgi:hypothetical protein
MSGAGAPGNVSKPTLEIAKTRKTLVFLAGRNRIASLHLWR